MQIYSHNVDLWQDVTKKKQPKCIGTQDCELSGADKNLSAKSIN